MSSMGRFQTGSASGLSAGYIMLRQDRCLLLRRIAAAALIGQKVYSIVCLGYRLKIADSLAEAVGNESMAFLIRMHAVDA